MIAALFRSEPTAKFFVDAEFGKVSLRRNANAKYVRLRVSEQGEITITMPRFAATSNAIELLENSRPEVREWRNQQSAKVKLFTDGDKIGRSHIVKFKPSLVDSVKTSKQGLTIVVEHPKATRPDDPKVQKALKPLIQKALQKEARAYLPRRLQYLANEHGFSYSSVRFGTQKGRWGSCSSKGTISLNVGLMLLEPELIDYVLIHELCHTRHMNHSASFWQEVEKYLPNYKQLRREVKGKSPSV